VRSGSDPGKFDDAQPRQWSRHNPYRPFAAGQPTQASHIFVPCPPVTSYTGIDDLTTSLDGHVLSVKLNRPDSLNSLTEDMLNTLADAVDRAADDPEVRVIRLLGAGRGFCSGAGIGVEDRSTRGSSTVDGLLLAANRAVKSITTSPKPVVTVVNGAAAGVGVSLALAGDIILASDRSFFLLAFTRIGLMPDGGATALVASAIGRIRAMRMALLAERISAADAFEFGLISAVYPDADLPARAATVIDTLVAGPTVALARTKQAINAATLTELDGAIGRETDGQTALLTARDFAEGARAFQQRRKPDFTDT